MGILAQAHIVESKGNLLGLTSSSVLKIRTFFHSDITRVAYVRMDFFMPKP